VAYRITSFLTTVINLQGNSHIANLSKNDISYCCATCESRQPDRFACEANMLIDLTAKTQTNNPRNSCRQSDFMILGLDYVVIRKPTNEILNEPYRPTVGVYECCERMCGVCLFSGIDHVRVRHYVKIIRLLTDSGRL